MQTHEINLDIAKGECITKVRGIYGAFISKLEFTTNFGKQYLVGHDYPKHPEDRPELELFLESL